MAATARFAVDNPRVVLLGILLAVVYGGLSFLALPRQENPSLNERYASVEVYLAGAEPEKVELLITQVIEDAVAELDDIEDIFSISSHGGSFVMIEIEPDAPVSERLQQVRDKIQEARNSFPEGATEPAVDTRVFRTNTMVLALLGEGVSGVALREQAQELERSLENLPIVRRVEVRGLPEEEIEVAIDLPRLAQRGITFNRVVAALAERNVKLPSGELDVGVVRSPIQTSGAFDVVEQIGQTYLGAGAEGLTVRLADVARVRRQLAEPDVKVRSADRKGVALGVEMLPGRNAIRFGERIRAHIETYGASLPAGMEVRIVADEPTYVDKRLRLLMTGLLFGLFLVIVLTLFGMGWRSGAVVSTTIPLAITAAMGVQDLLGVPLHQISIAAIVIAIGIVVDESIVVTDNIQRHLDEGRAPREAAIRGLGEIHMAVLAGAGTTIAAFIPLMLMEGDIGDFIRSIPIVVSAMLGASVLVAHFVTPLLCKLAHEHLPAATERRPLAGRLEPFYLPLLHFVTERRGVVLTSFAVGIVVVTGASLSVLLPPTFFPDADRNQFLIKVFLPSGAPLRETEAAMMRMDEILGEETELQDWTLFIGSAAPKFYYNELEEGRGENQGQIVVNTLPSIPFHRIRELVARVDRRLEDEIPGAFIRTHALRQGYGGGDDIRVFILGDDLSVLRALSQEVRSIVAQVPGIEGARDSFGYDPITIQANVHDATANLLGISHLDIATALHAGIEGVRASTLQENDDEIAIRVRLDSERRRDIHELEELPIWSPRGQETVPLAQVASLEPGFSTQRVMRYNRKREASVNAGLVPGESLLAVAAQVESSVRERVRLPAGYEFFFAGQQEEVTESFLSLAKATVSAVFLIYIILVLRFQSLAQPGLILLAIPMAIAGSCLGLAVTGTDMAFMSFLGMISLAGIAVNDSIVLIDTINRLRREGMMLLEAVREGARLRLRAVLLTSVTTIGGLIPLSLSGGEFWQPFGFAMIFGLGASTILTLLIQPAAYLALEHRRDRGVPGQT